MQTFWNKIKYHQIDSYHSNIKILATALVVHRVLHNPLIIPNIGNHHNLTHTPPCTWCRNSLWDSVIVQYIIKYNVIHIVIAAIYENWYIKLVHLILYRLNNGGPPRTVIRAGREWALHTTAILKFTRHWSTMQIACKLFFSGRPL